MMDTLSTEPYQLGTGDDAVLLIHGLGGSPYDLRPLAEALAAQGMHSEAPLLPGHGGSTDGAEIDENDWLRVGASALERLNERGGSVFIVGFSMGGALAIRLAASRPELVDGLILLAPALALRGPSRIFRMIFRHRSLSSLLPRIEKGPGDLCDRSVAMPKAAPLPTRWAGALDRTIEAARTSLPQVRAPALVLWGARDRVVPKGAAVEAAKGVGSGPAPLVILERSAHQLALDYDREEVAAKVVSFLEPLRAKGQSSAGELAPGRERGQGGGGNG